MDHDGESVTTANAIDASATPEIVEEVGDRGNVSVPGSASNGADDGQRKRDNNAIANSSDNARGVLARSTNHEEQDGTTANSSGASVTHEIANSVNASGDASVVGISADAADNGQRKRDNNGLANPGGTVEVATEGTNKSTTQQRTRATGDAMIRRREGEIAEIEERRKKRNERERTRLQELKDKNRKRIAARKREDLELFDRQEAAARYRLADALLKELANLPDRDWPPLLKSVIAARSEEDRAAFARILGKLISAKTRP